MEGAGILVWLIMLVISVVLIIAQLRLFSIDRSLKSILEVLSRGNQQISGASPAADPAAGPVTEAQRARIADLQKNWPGYK